ncbi:MAG: hypothetical protein ACREC6_06175 [Hyphomicrobiaceae bacterium]
MRHPRKKKEASRLGDDEIARGQERRKQFEAIGAVEGIVPTPEMQAAFEMFDRERWGHERRRAYIIARFAKKAF